MIIQLSRNLIFQNQNCEIKDTSESTHPWVAYGRKITMIENAICFIIFYSLEWQLMWKRVQFRSVFVSFQYKQIYIIGWVEGPSAHLVSPVFPIHEKWLQNFVLTSHIMSCMRRSHTIWNIPISAEACFPGGIHYQQVSLCCICMFASVLSYMKYEWFEKHYVMCLWPVYICMSNVNCVWISHWFYLYILLLLLLCMLSYKLHHMHINTILSVYNIIYTCIYMYHYFYLTLYALHMHPIIIQTIPCQSIFFKFKTVMFWHSKICLHGTLWWDTPSDLGTFSHNSVLSVPC